MRRIYLTEYETTEHIPLTLDQIQIIAQRSKSKNAGNPYAEIIYDAQGVKLRSTSQVGFIPLLDDLQLVVSPKISTLTDFFYIIRKSGLEPGVFPDNSLFAARAESEVTNVPDFITRQLLHNLRTLKRDGFYRRPVQRSENRSSIKGKLQVTATLRNCWTKGHMHQVTCAYFDTTANTIENRFIKYTLWLLINTSGLAANLRRDAKRFYRLFDNIPLSRSEHYVHEIEYIVRKREIPTSRSYYLVILSLCLLIVSNTTVVIKQGEDIRLSAFAIDMNRTFEHYVYNVLVHGLSKDYRVLNGNDEFNKQPLFSNVDKPRITPDIMIAPRTQSKAQATIATSSRQEFLMVCDAKYKRSTKPSDDDWYQVIAYMAALDVPSGVLIYPAEQKASSQRFDIGGRSVWVYYFPLQDLLAEEKALVQFVRARITDEFST